MIGKIIKGLLLIILSVLIFCAASVLGVRRDDKKAKLAKEAAQSTEPAQTAEIISPYEKYKGGVLELQMDYEVQLSSNDVIISVVSNLPDGYDLTADLSNVEAVKKDLGLDGISSSALSPEQMASINEKTYTKREKNFVSNGVCNFTFSSPPAGQLDLKITSPITKLQPSSVQSLLGDKGENLQGNYVVYLEEVADKSINFTASFLLEDPSGGTSDSADKTENSANAGNTENAANAAEPGSAPNEPSAVETGNADASGAEAKQQ